MHSFSKRIVPSCWGEPMLNVFPREIVHLALQAIDHRVTFLREIVEFACVDGDAGRFHARQDRNERQLDVFIERELIAFGELRAPDRREAQCGIRGGGRFIGERAIQMLRRHIGGFPIRARRIDQVSQHHRVLREALASAMPRSRSAACSAFPS